MQYNSSDLQQFNEQNQIIREDTKELAKSINNIYSNIILSCQKQCLQGFNQSDEFTSDERTCLTKCVNKHMFLDNFLYETDSANEIASEQGKTKKAVFYQNRRIEDLTRVDVV
ncbi:UNKNOWN [Stylonychia lemnae]|uniref:Mitochondrial import inner membrane translocase subunit n=1 Tax=Stylonychia lemnae TaxID=5949 RepID=A0A078AK14_STYLE|nr:UNKNOWN [Stylonychia lemnae]|eukprot:CDW82241.1 UNKNOWN [Stylonychia lemnae]